jgi:hypothetical protein
MARTATMILLSALGLALLAPSAALAGHVRAGLWEITVKMNSEHMDLSQIPPEALARMKAAGMSMSDLGGSRTFQRCRTPEEAAQDRPPSVDHDCSLTNVSYGPNGMSADVTCAGHFTGTGHVHFTWDSDVHYAGDVSINGSAHGHEMSNSQHIEGRWLSAQCPAPQ